MYFRSFIEFELFWPKSDSSKVTDSNIEETFFLTNVENEKIRFMVFDQPLGISIVTKEVFLTWAQRSGYD